MDLNNDERSEFSVDSAYGGCKYRLSYDAAELKRELRAKKRQNGSKKVSTASKLRTIAAVVSVVVVFIVFGICILSYYNNAVKKIFGSTEEQSSDSKPSYYTNVNVVVD